MSRIRLTPEERQAKLDAAHQRLVEAVDELRSSDDWLRYLGFMARFHDYSVSNIVMIFSQRPDATQVGGFHTWKSMGRSVKKGAKGIAILAPMVRKFTDAEPGQAVVTESIATPTDTVQRIVGFRIVYVFDVSDTEGESLPEVPHARLLEGDAPELMWDALAAQVAAAGFALEPVDNIEAVPSAHGVTDHANHVVQIATEGRSRAAQAKCLAHELAHVLLHKDVNYQANRGRCEVEAESVAYLVCHAFGLDSMEYTLGYVSSWAGANHDVVLATATTVQKCANAIVATALPDTDTEDQEVAA